MTVAMSSSSSPVVVVRDRDGEIPVGDHAD
jgi:hypothetical protein